MKEQLIGDDNAKSTLTNVQRQHKELSFKNKDAFQSQTFISNLLYTWAYHIIKLSHLTQIKLDDLGFICKLKSCSTYIQHVYATYFTKQYKSKRYSLLKTLLRTHVSTITLITLLNIVYTFIKITSIILFRKYIQSFHTTPSSQSVVHIALYIISFDIIELFLSKHLEKVQTKLAYTASIEVNCLIFTKILKTPLITQNQITSAELVNYTQVDAQNIVHVIRLFPVIINVPIMVIVYSVMLFKYMGIAFVFGVIVLFVFVMCNLCLQKRMKRNMGLRQKALDVRMKATSNVLFNLKLLKLYAWDSFFLSKIESTRKDELTRLTNVFKIANVIRTLLWFSPVGTIIISICAYSYLGKAFTAENVFTCLSIFNLIQDPLRAFGNVVNSIMEMFVSMERIEKYLNQPNMNTKHIVHDNNNDNDIALMIKNGNFKWNDNKNGSFELNGIDVSISKGKLVFVVGEIGSGKSSLLHAVMGNIQPITNETEVFVNGSVSYVSQIPWIQNDTVRNNVLFYKAMIESKYNEVITLCQLTEDLNMFVNGDHTQIGEKGVTLSGGQKMRIALARGLYADSDIYLLDDPLAALDANVGKSIMSKCIKEYLHGKTRIVVTHSLQYLNYAEQILLIKNGKVVFNGTYKDIQSNSYYNEFIKRNNTGCNDVVNKECKEGTVINVNNTQRQDNKRNNVLLNVNNTSPLHQQSQVNNNNNSNINKGKQMNIYTKYIKTNGGYTMCIIVCVFVLIWQISRGISDIYLVNWTKSKYTPTHDNDNENTNYYLCYAGFAIMGSLFIYIRLTYISKHTLKGSSKLHTDMIYSIIHAPINLYHDIIPRGQIMNQLSKDLSVVDFLGSVMFGNILSFGSSFIFSLLICSLYQVYCLIYLPILLFGGIYLMKFYLKGCRQVTRLESESRTPLINLINEVSSGSDTIRAFNTEQSFIDCYYACQDTFLKTNLFLNGVNLWFGLMVDLLIFSFKVCLIVLTLYLKQHLPSEVIGLLLAYSIQIQNSLESFLQCFSTFENAMLAFQRCVTYTNIKSERPYKMEKDSEQWPSKGKIDFNAFSMRYRPNLDNVLHNVTMRILPGEKIGVCGRTGSGKSSIALSLFRIIEASEGSISIDDVNINEIGLDKLRQAITIIPQEPCLFEGTLRYNVDPIGKYSDEEIERVMKRFNWEKEMELGMSINVNGNNLSVGQKQIVCFIRAVLRNSKVMVIDEGTASIDYKNEEVILKELIEVMKDSTVIVIAHRIKTIVNMDRVIVLDNGKVVEFDSPKVLLSNRESKFYELYNSFTT